MQNNRLGCLTGAGFITAILTLLVIAGVAFASGGHMFSSGDLNNQPGETIGGVNSHAQISECKACHTAPWERETMANRCVACHTNIAKELLNVDELHGAIARNDSSLTCRDCHREHRGAHASLTELGAHTFPHEVLGYSLNGHQFTMKREAFVCSDCHGDDITTFSSDSCVTCHSDIDIVFTKTHLLTFGQNCLDCH
ncbi:MAG: cytochrome c3 family protein, partial [Anaerolineales bacterium]